MRYFLIALTALTFSQAPAFAGDKHCDCKKDCATQCEKGKTEKCKCDNGDCKTGHCKHHCNMKDKAKDGKPAPVAT